MAKYLWSAGGLTLLAVLVLFAWHRSVDRRAETEDHPAVAVMQDAKPARQAGPGTRLEASSKLAQVAASPASAPRAPSGVSDASDQADPGAVDTRWRVAVGLPEEVREQLANSDDAILREILQRNHRLMNASAEGDPWGPDMQARLVEFFDSRPEADGIQITVACGEGQCQVQAMSPVQSAAGATSPARALFDELRQHWWFRDQLIMAQGHVTTVHGRLYHVQYFDRHP
jgi:hypothetical protein